MIWVHADGSVAYVQKQEANIAVLFVLESRSPLHYGGLQFCKHSIWWSLAKKV